MFKLLELLLKASSLFSGALGPLLVTWTGIHFINFPGWSDSTVFSVNSAFWAAVVQLILMVVNWLDNILSQKIEVYASKENTFNGDSKLTVNFDTDPVKLNFRVMITGSNKYLSKKNVELIFPGQVHIELPRDHKNTHCQIINNRVSIKLKEVVSGQTKHLHGYAQDFTVLLLKDDISFKNYLKVENKNGLLLKQSLKTEVEMVAQ